MPLVELMQAAAPSHLPASIESDQSWRRASLGSARGMRSLELLLHNASEPLILSFYKLPDLSFLAFSDPLDKLSKRNVHATLGEKLLDRMILGQRRNAKHVLAGWSLHC